jgi:peptidoglycan/LPS O-acetylase OafA/YrhL
MHESHEPAHLYSLDVLRGVAALSVVFWHWNHFFFDKSRLGDFDVTQLPLYQLLLPIYTSGWRAVDLFFALSGFVFFWLYADTVASGRTSPARFALLRLSRLYPLNLLTLVIVGMGQVWFLNRHGYYLIYPVNDTYHFFLNLAFASSWGLEQGFSFNGPVWSVSVEVLLYTLFFVCCRYLPINALVLGLFSMVGLLVVYRYYPPIGRGLGSFFAGGCAFLAYQSLRCRARSRQIAVLVGCLVVVCWGATYAVLSTGLELRAISLKSLPSGHLLDQAWKWAVHQVLRFWTELALFPITVLGLALIESTRGSRLKMASFLGDISYSSYLLHFPLQMLFFGVWLELGVENSLFYSPWVMLTFFLVLVALSLASFHLFERPLQAWLRRHGGERRANAPAAART